ncbi:hypothetical protein [Streptosporangium sp. NPDC003464]
MTVSGSATILFTLVRSPLQQGFRGGAAGGLAVEDLGGHWFSGKVDHHVIALSGFSRRLYGVQPVRRLERSIKVVHGRMVAPVTRAARR